MHSLTNSQAPIESFILNRKSYLFRDISEEKIILDNKSEFDVVTMEFIKQWFSGKNNFQLQTSGSTGKPKKINFTKNQLQKSALRSINAFKLKSGETILVCLNTAFVAGMMMLVRALEGQLKLIIETPSANPLANIENGEAIDFCALTPYQAKTVLEETPLRLATIKTLLIGGAALDPSLEDALQKVKTKVYHSYAMTETLTHVALRQVNGEEKSNIYYALQGVSFSQDVRKCLIIQDQILGIEHLVTNDIVELLNKKSFRWIGRYDNIVNSGGIKIQVEELEKNIYRILDNLGIDSSFCLLSIPDKMLNNKLILLIEQNEKLLDEKNILLVLKNNLPVYHNPKAIKQVSEIYLTKSGKIDRKRNADFYLRK